MVYRTKLSLLQRMGWVYETIRAYLYANQSAEKTAQLFQSQPHCPGYCLAVTGLGKTPFFSKSPKSHPGAP